MEKELPNINVIDDPAYTFFVRQGVDVKTDFPFEFQVMSIPKSISKGETVRIRYTIKTKIIIMELSIRSDVVYVYR